MSVRRALEADLRKLPVVIRDGPLAQIALTLAETLDGDPGARDAAAVAKELRATMAEIRETAAEQPQESDPIDELAKRRAGWNPGAALPNRTARGGE